MLRYRLLIPVFFALAFLLLWVLPVTADTPPDPATCLPYGGRCYASNIAPAGGNGTRYSQWVVTDTNVLRTLVQNYVSAHGLAYGSLLITMCSDAQATQCAGTLYEYNANGPTAVTDVTPVPPPISGVPIPMPYLLIGLTLLGVALVGIGIVLRRRSGAIKAPAG